MKKKNTIQGVYKIENIINGEIYIGSSINIRERWYHHKHYLRKGNHHSNRFQSAWNEFGESSFSFSILEIIEKSEELLSREKYWIDFSKPQYNMVLEPGSTKGYKHTTECRERMSQKQKIRFAKYGTSHLKYTRSEEYKKKLSEIAKNRPQSYYDELGVKKQGSKHPFAILTEEDVIEIKKGFRDGIKGKELASTYGVSKQTICDIKKGRIWTHVTLNEILP